MCRCPLCLVKRVAKRVQIAAVKDRLTGADKRVMAMLRERWQNYDHGQIIAEYEFKRIGLAVFGRCCGQQRWVYTKLRRERDKRLEKQGFSPPLFRAVARMMICSRCGSLREHEYEK